MIPKYFEFQSSAKILSGRHALENLPSDHASPIMTVPGKPGDVFIMGLIGTANQK